MFLLAALVMTSPAPHSVFAVTKSDNKNQVHYAMQLDGQCRPKKNAPVVVYWQMLERGDDVIEPLSRLERTAFGIDRQQVRVAPRGGQARIRLRALPELPLIFQSRKRGSRCAVRAIVRDGPDKIVVDSVHVVIAPRGALGFEVTLRGRLQDGRHITRRVER